MYRIYDPEEVLEAVGFAHPIKGFPDYDYKKGFNDGLNWLSEVCSIEYIKALDENSIIVVFSSYVLPIIEDYGKISITDVKYYNIVYFSNGRIIGNIGISTDGPE